MAKSRKSKSSEVILYLCTDHYDFPLSAHYPDHVFNSLPSYNHGECEVSGCVNKAFYRFIGIKIPDNCPNLSNKSSALVADEIYFDGVRALSNGLAVDKLTSYLYYKTRVYTYNSGDLAAVVVCKQLAKLLLKELKISETESLTTTQINAILKALLLYPPDWSDDEST